MHSSSFPIPLSSRPTSTSSTECSCLLLVYGIPASGKTLLTRKLLKCGSKRHPEWNWLAVHFDHFYPPDTRTAKASELALVETFDLKSTRGEVLNCLETLLGCNTDEASVHPTTSSNVPEAKFNSFVRSLNSSKCLFDKTGRLLDGCGKRNVFILDDNMPLQSMRHQCYCLARKFKLGFAQLCVTCPTSIALSRNAIRPIPIPDSTILTMERNLELPNPSQHHWEIRHAVVKNDTDDETNMLYGCACAIQLVEDAMQNPVIPQTEDVSELQEASRTANLASRVHQADNILRKCVSQFLQAATSGSNKAELAKNANGARKKLLSDVREGVVIICGLKRWTAEDSSLDHLQQALEEAFQDAVN